MLFKEIIFMLLVCSVLSKNSNKNLNENFLQSLETYNTRHGKFKVLQNDKYVVEALKVGDLLDEEILLIIKSFLNKNKIVIEVGAHIGTWSIPLSKVVPKVYSFEPQSSIFKILKMNMDLNSANNIEAINAGLCHTDTTYRMNSFITENNERIYLTNDYSMPVNYQGAYLGEAGEEVKLTSLDSLELDNVGLLIVKANGTEKLALVGSQNTINSNLPIILYTHDEEKTHSALNERLLNDLNVPSEAREFNIESLCYRNLSFGYYTKFQLTKIHYLLFPIISTVLHEVLIQMNFDGDFKFVVENDQRELLLEINHVYNYQVFTLSKDEIWIFFDNPDHAGIIGLDFTNVKPNFGIGMKGKVTDKGIKWKNNIEWKVKKEEIDLGEIVKGSEKYADL